jgi:hypothetical protein
VTQDYTKKLMALLETGPQTNAVLRVACGFASNDCAREVDAALQKLRKAGRIRPGRQDGRAVWIAESLHTCPKCKGTGLVKA